MAGKEDFWSVPPLSAEDQRIVGAYAQVGKSVDQLPYTNDFKELMRKLGEDPTEERMFHVFQRLLQLRKKGRLPRVNQPSEYY